jgi:UDP-glucose:glycoprotein glucosyltransferase
VDELEETQSWPDTTPIIRALRFKPGETGLLLNGRKIGPVPSDIVFTPDDFEILYKYETRKRNMPAQAAMNDLGIFTKLKSPVEAAMLYSLLAVSTISDVPEGIFEQPPPIRGNVFYQWGDTHTAITMGDNTTAVIQLVSALDPASETAQRWVPVLKVLSQLDGVFLKIFMNPKEYLEELPVKRFYRYVLDDKPSFNEDGSVKGLAAKFTGIPAQALLTMAMDVPPSWLVTSRVSIHDLDNIKLSSLSPGADVDATYELEYILIEGHSRDGTAGSPPRGAQLALSTARDPLFADTIIMANLGYFQFKANPGHYNIELKEGPSRDIFHIDSVGAMGYEPQEGDQTTEVTLMSFLGVTLYPRLSRKPGKEEDDVLGSTPPPTNKAANLVKQGADFVGGLLQKAGVGKDDKKALGTFYSLPY